MLFIVFSVIWPIRKEDEDGVEIKILRSASVSAYITAVLTERLVCQTLTTLTQLGEQAQAQARQQIWSGMILKGREQHKMQ